MILAPSVFWDMLERLKRTVNPASLAAKKPTNTGLAGCFPQSFQVEPGEVYTPPMILGLSESGITFVPLFVPLQLLTEKDLNSLCCKFTPGMVRLDILAV